MSTTTETKTNGSGRSSEKLPLRGKKNRQAKNLTPLPLRAGKNKGRKIDGALQENILTLLCFGSKDSIDEIIATVPVSLFESDVYRTIAGRAINYYRKYDEAAGDHLADLFEDLLSNKLYYALMGDLYDVSKTFNSQFVLDSLQDFVDSQTLRLAITDAAFELKKGYLDSTIRLLKQGVEKTEGPSSRKVLAPIRTVQELMSAEIPSLQEIFDPILQYPAILLLLGARGSFKSLFAMSMAISASSGEDLFDWRCDRKCRVLFLDFEMQFSVGKQRFKMLQKSLGLKPQTGMLDTWYAADSQPKPIPNLCDRDQTNALIEQCSEYDLLFLDNVAAAARGADLNKAEEIEPIRDLVTQLQHRGTSTVVVHHLGKDPSRGARGSSALEDVPDTILKLKSTESPAGTSLITVTQTKSRHHSPSEFGPIKIAVDSSHTGLSIKHETIRESKSSLLASEYLRLLKAGKITKGTQLSLAKQYRLHKSTVSIIARKVSRKFHKGKNL